MSVLGKLFANVRVRDFRFQVAVGSSDSGPVKSSELTEATNSFLTGH